MVFQRLADFVFVSGMVFSKHDGIKTVSTIRANPTPGEIAEEGNVLKEKDMFEHIVTT